MATKFKVIKTYAPFEVGDILELTGDKLAYTNGYAYINKREVEKTPSCFEVVEEKENPPLTADSFFGGDKK